MKSKLSLNRKIFKAYQLKGNFNDLLQRLETHIDESINEPAKLSEIIKNVPGGSLVTYLNTNPTSVETSL